jgi:phage gp46-like protein
VSVSVQSTSALQSAARYAAPGTTGGALDIALAYDPARRGCDLVWNGGDFALDTTPVTNMLMALGCDRRAHPTDTLPENGAAWAGAPDAPLADLRRGWVGDALDAQGRRTGSRLWLLARARATEQTRKFAESAAAEALSSIQSMVGVSIQLLVRWIGPNMLGLRASAGDAVVNVTQAVGP